MRSKGGAIPMPERLQKLIAAAGISSRRHAEELITAGRVTVNGKVVTELGAKADPKTDHIKVNGKLINPALKPRDRIYVLLNKPKGYLTSLADPEGRPLVAELVPSSLGRLHPVGRLDFNTEGLLLMTDDGEFTNYLTAARNRIDKVYEVKVKGIPPEAAITRLRRGLKLDDDVPTAPAEVTLINHTAVNAWFEVILHEGRNQQIRRMFDAIGHSVLKLTRVCIGPLRETKMKPGQWRFLTKEEVKQFYRQPRAVRDKTRSARNKTRGTRDKTRGARDKTRGARRGLRVSPR